MAVALDIRASVEVAPAVIATSTTVATAPLLGCEQDAPQPVLDEDEQLLNRLAENDEAAFRLLVERHIDRAFGVALRIVGNRADAEDVVQDTMLKVWTHRGQWQHGRAKFSTWLYRVVTNRCIDLHRQPRTDNVDAVPEPADARPDVVSTMQRDEVTHLLEDAMRRLPEQQRIAVIFSYHENMSNGEIAEVMETTVAAVESLLKRGRQQLRELLRRHERDIRHVFTDC
ncbi:RNA polymerase sigma-70 factor (ECF subfamily) [Rhodopseudomonas rhenobacensis]|uniref:RNA polymerase sigma factor n=1 Tax=Rhodopseudomonas rhenobacensis TaxID=87461 RepID=A0A7W8E1Q2_9BRAD|nr:RNA polymerase sigma factor [Rhodopseudomonas rhenobacensis]MBB5049146.1 RNA polymerase sigma-70 factor (ECF subfamily) [Rhodopseudomonas rhenobacensis]